MVTTDSSTKMMRLDEGSAVPITASGSSVLFDIPWPQVPKMDNQAN